MGVINGNSETVQHEKDQLLWGNNEFETGTLKLGADESAADGTLLVRAADGTLSVASAIDAPVFVLVDRGSYTEAGSYPVRAAISGSFNRERLTLAGAALTDAQADALRGYGILALKSKNYGSGDNE